VLARAAADGRDRARGHPRAAGAAAVSEWWRGVAPAQASVDCGGERHRLRWEAGELCALDHEDPGGERALAAVGGERPLGVGVLDAWQRHATDLSVLVLASRGPSDPLQPADEEETGWVAWGPGADDEEPAGFDLPALLRLGGGLPRRLAAGVVASSLADPAA